jgi:hypothetical protein
MVRNKKHMSAKNIKFFEIEYNYRDNPTAEKMTAIVTDAEYSKKAFLDIDDQIFLYDMDEEYLKILVEIGHITFNDFIVYSYKEISSVFEDTEAQIIKSRLVNFIDMINSLPDDTEKNRILKSVFNNREGELLLEFLKK